MSSTELVTTFGDSSFESIAAATGANIRTNGLGLPTMRINKTSEDDFGHTVPVGTYFVSHNDTTYYAKQAIFRVFMNTYQYMQYDDKSNSYPNKSIIIKNFNEQAIDEQGGLKCGKVTRKEMEELVAGGVADPTYVAAQRAIKCYRGLYGLVSFPDAVTAEGERAVVDKLPVLWRMSGDNFMVPQTALDAITKMRHISFQHNLKLNNPVRKKQGTNIWYVGEAEAILNEEIEFSAEDMVTFRVFQEHIDSENHAVTTKWTASKKSSVYDLEKSSLADLELNDDISDL